MSYETTAAELAEPRTTADLGAEEAPAAEGNKGNREAAMYRTQLRETEAVGSICGRH